MSAIESRMPVPSGTLLLVGSPSPDTTAQVQAVCNGMGWSLESSRDVYGAMAQLAARRDAGAVHAILTGGEHDRASAEFQDLAPRYFNFVRVSILREFLRGSADQPADASPRDAGVLRSIFETPTAFGVFAETGTEYRRDAQAKLSVRAFSDVAPPAPARPAGGSAEAEPAITPRDINHAAENRLRALCDADEQSATAPTSTEPSLHDAVRLRMMASVAGDAAVPRVQRIPPRIVPEETIEPSVTPPDEGPLLTREELEALLGPPRDGGGR